MRVVVTALLLALAAGCAAPQHLEGTTPADPPAGYVDYCARHADRAECGK